MRLYRVLSGSGIAITKDMDEIDYLRRIGLQPVPGCPFSMEPLSKPQEKVWYDFGFTEDKWDEVNGYNSAA